MKLLSIFLGVFLFIRSSLTTEKQSIQIKSLKSNLLNFAYDFKKDTSQCGKDLQLYVDALQQFKPWATLMFDATSKLQSGLATGNIWGLGNFDECLDVVAGREYNNITGKYCLGAVPIPPGIALQQGLVEDLISEASVQWGVCVPKSCSYIDVKNISTKLLLNTNLSLKIEEDSCYTKDQKHEINKTDVLAMCIFGTIVVLMLLSTLYEYYTIKFDKSIRHPILISFSLQSNCKQLFKVTPVTKESKVIYCFTGIRSLSMAWIIYGHSVLTAAYTPSFNVLDEIKVLRAPIGQLVIGARMAVDTFFVISGALVSYIILSKLKNGIRFRDIPIMYIHRYLRLTPAFAAVILFQVSLVRFLGSGPIWNQAYKIYTQPCLEDWWRSLLYFQNFKNPTKMCIGQSWYLSVDTQLFVLAPFLMILFQKWRKLTYPCLTLLTLVTMIYTFVVAFQNKLKAGDLRPDLDERTALIYVATQARGGAYFIGMGLGYFLYDNKGKSLHLSKKTVLVGWIIFFSVLSSIIYGGYHFVQADYKFHLVADPMYTTLHRIGWSLSIVWIIITCEFGYAGPINKILSWKMLQPLSRLTYSQYLVHASYQIMSRATYRVPVFINIFSLFTQFISDFVMATLLAIILHLAFESPLINVEHIILKTAQGKEKTESKNNEGNYGLENRSFVFDRDHSTKC